MKKISFIIFLLIMPISYATAALDKDEEYFSAAKKVVKRYSNDTMDPEYKSALQECAKNGNYYCAQVIGNINLEEKNYTDAVNNFKKCSEKDGGECDFRLGLIYYEGLGVLQNDDKAISFFNKSANLGHSTAAYNISVIYAKKKPGRYDSYKYSSEGSKQYSNFTILEYAWLKIAMALGEEHYNSIDDEKLPIAKLFASKKDNLASDGLLQQGDKMAEQICSKNKFCRG